MKVYKVIDGYISEIKTVKDNYILEPNDTVGEPLFGIGCNVSTGSKKPKTAEQLYELERHQALEDITILEEDIKLGIATEADKTVRKEEWLAYYDLNKDKREK